MIFGKSRNCRPSDEPPIQRLLQVACQTIRDHGPSRRRLRGRERALGGPEKAIALETVNRRRLSKRCAEISRVYTNT